MIASLSACESKDSATVSATESTDSTNTVEEKSENRNWPYVFSPYLIVAAVMGVVIYFAMKSHNKMVADGKIISRRTNFMESAEEFTLSAVYPAQVTEAVKAIDYAEMRTKMQGSNEQQLFKFTGSTWSAQLHKLRDNGTQVVYRFEFTNWKTHNGMPQDGLNMNKLTTAVEKIFLSLDPNTQVRTVPLEFKTKHSIL